MGYKMNLIDDYQPNEIALDKVFDKWIISTRDCLWRCKENDGFGIGNIVRIVKKDL